MHIGGDKCNASNKMDEAKADRNEDTSSTLDSDVEATVEGDAVTPVVEESVDPDSVRRIEAFEEVDKRLQEIEDREKEGNRGRQALMDSISGVLDVLGSTRECLQYLGKQQRRCEESEESMAEIIREQLEEALECRNSTSAALQNMREVRQERTSTSWVVDERVKQIEKQCESLQTECNVLKGKLVRAQLEVSTLQRRLLHRTIGFAVLLAGVVVGLSSLDSVR